MANRKRIVTVIDSLKDYRIFVSYPRGGKAHTWAEAVQAFLQNEHARVWRDETGVQEGDSDWVAQIDSALRASDLLVAIVGMESKSAAGRPANCSPPISTAPPSLHCGWMTGRPCPSCCAKNSL